MSDHADSPLKCMCQEFHPNPSDKQRYIDLRLEGMNVTGEWGKGYRACQQAADAAIAEIDAERDKWEWVARDACRELAYETHVNPQSPLDYRLANWRPRED